YGKAPNDRMAACPIEKQSRSRHRSLPARQPTTEGPTPAPKQARASFWSFCRGLVQVDLPAGLLELLGLLGHGRADFGAGQSVVGALGGVAHFLADLHRAEFRPAHGAETRDLGAFGWQGLVVIELRGLRIECQGELVAPAELEPRL